MCRVAIVGPGSDTSMQRWAACEHTLDQGRWWGLACSGVVWGSLSQPGER